MQEDEFWRLVRRLADAHEELDTLTDAQLVDFARQLDVQVVRADDSRLWAAGFLAAGGMSEDAFDSFRLWLVLQGREAFERVLAEPDELADLVPDDEDEGFADAEWLRTLLADVLTGRGLPLDQGPSPTTAAPFPEDGDWLSARFPRLWRRAEASGPGNGADDYRITDADVARFVRRIQEAKEPRPVEPVPPLLAATLFHIGQIRDRDRPMLAAHWLAEGRDGEALLELASLSGPEREVDELWPLALEELGVHLPVTGARAAMAWAARRVLDGERDPRWLVRALWPGQDVGEDPQLDTLVYTVQDWLAWLDRDGRSADPALRARAEEGQSALRAALEAMARDDIKGALGVLDEQGRRIDGTAPR